MHIILGIILEFIIAVFCEYPGAFIRWLIFRRKPFRKYLDDGWPVNMFPIAIMIAIIMFIAWCLGTL